MTVKPNPNHRFDAPHQEQAAPYILKSSEQKIAEMICRMLENDEISAREVGQHISGFEVVPEDLLDLVNDSLPRHKKAISDPVHAAVMVGSGRLQSFLNSYMPKAADDENTAVDEAVSQHSVEIPNAG